MNEINKAPGFTSIYAYRSFVQKRYRIESKHLYYLNDTCFDRFLYWVAGEKLDYFLGVFPNDSSRYLMSSFLRENESCAGRVMNEIINASKDSVPPPVERSDLFKQFCFLSIDEKIPFEFIKDKRIILLVFSTQLGKLRKRDFYDIQQYVKNRNDLQLVVVSLDQLYDKN